MDNNTTYEQKDCFFRVYEHPMQTDGRKSKDHSVSDANKKPEPHIYTGQVLTLDTETLKTPDKSLLYGVFMLTGYTPDEQRWMHVRGEKIHREALRQVGIFYSDELTTDEIDIIHAYTANLRLEEIAKRLDIPCDPQDGIQIVQVGHVDTFNAFLYNAFKQNEIMVLGLNLPFDLSRLAYEWYEPRGKDTGSFALVLCRDGKHCNVHPEIQLKTFGFAKCRYSLARSFYTNRHSGKRMQSRWFSGVHFVNCMTLSDALLGTAMGLEKLGDTLDIASELRKKDRPDDYRPTSETLDYAMTDVLATFACFQKLRELYERHALSKPMWYLYSGASLGKAYLQDIGLKPFMTAHPDFPKDVIGYAMNAYYGGRSEIHYRLTPGLGNLRDFTGLYSTVNALMGLQRYRLAEEIQVNRLAADWVQELLTKEVSELLELLHSKDVWLKMPVLVQLIPDGDRLPLRASYDGEEISTNIALPYVKSDTPLWYTLPDVIVSKLLTGHTPNVIQAIEIIPSNEQYKTNPIKFFGEETIDLSKEEFFTRIGDLRQTFMKLKKQDSDYYDNLQNAAKLLANSSNYGIQVEIDVNEETTTDENDETEAHKKEFGAIFYDLSGRECSTIVTKQEKTGTYFSPLGVFITGGARLMLAIAEKLYANTGMAYGFMDTDSIFVLQPDTMSLEDFMSKEQEVATWFQALSPYQDETVQILKLEYKNVWLFAISAKRYVLYRKGEQVLLGNGEYSDIELVKVSSHGLGAMSRPYDNKTHYFADCPKEYHVEGVKRWVCDLWFMAIRAIEQGKMINSKLTIPRVGSTQEPRLGERWLPFRMPAMHQISLTTPHLLKTYGDIPGSRPYNFFTLLRAIPSSALNYYAKNTPEYEYLYELISKQVTLYTGSHDPDSLSDVKRSDTHEPVEPWISFATVAQSLHEYFSHPESKAREPHGVGILYPRYVYVEGVRYIGKEVTNVLEELQEEADNAFTEETYFPVEYRERDVSMAQAIRRYNPSDVMLVSGIDRRTLQRATNGKTNPHPTTKYKLTDAIKTLEENKQVYMWKEWPIERLSTVAHVDLTRAKLLLGGQVSFTPLERQRILHALEQDNATRVV